MASCSCRRKSAAPGPSSVADAPGKLELLADAVRALPGVIAVTIEHGEVVARAARDGLIPLMTTLRDGPVFLMEQAIDICGVDWPERPERFDVVYNLLSVSLNQRLRVIVTTDEVQPVPSVCGIWPVADGTGVSSSVSTLRRIRWLRLRLKRL